MSLPNMVESCILCRNEILKDSLKFKKTDLITNEILVPQGMTDTDLICTNCFNLRLEDPLTNVGKSRTYLLLDIVRQEMGRKEFDVASLIDKLDKEMNKWPLSEADRGRYMENVMKMIESDLEEEQSYMFSGIKKIKDVFTKKHARLLDELNDSDK